MSTRDSDFEITTRRPTGALMDALQAGESRAEACANLLVHDLDAGEGWIDHHDGSWWWYPGRLAVEVKYSADGDLAPYVEASIRVLRAAEPTEELTSWLNDLNAHALGWWWWWDQETGEVRCSMRCAVNPQTWWWPMVLHQVLPHAVTVAESMASILADAGIASVAESAHPTRGPRAQVDGWILGTRLGPRDMSASLDPWIAESELARLQAALTVIAGRAPDEVAPPLTVVLRSEDGQPRITLRRHWHASWGWGWQFATLTGIRGVDSSSSADGRAMAAFLNQAQGTAAGATNLFGGWVFDQDAGLLHLTFVPALIVDVIISSAGPTIGDVAALMMEVPHRSWTLEALPLKGLPDSLSLQSVADDFLLQLRTLTYRLGPIGWSYELAQGSGPGETGREEKAAKGTWTAEQPDELWNIPKHYPVCSFGIFNPMGPTVSSLEVGMTGKASGIEFSLFHVMRHPHLPEIRWLGTVDDMSELVPLIESALSDRNSDSTILGSGPEWMEIWAYEDAILAGLRSFAEADDETDWRATADELVRYAVVPWGRVSPREESDFTTFNDNDDPIECWITAITDYVVIVGQKLFMRSAWEGALAYRKSNWDAAEAQRAADSPRNGAQERLEADVESRR